MTRPSQIAKVVEVTEFRVPTSDGDELLFRLEVSASKSARNLRYRCRLYRLESFKFRVRNTVGTRTGAWSDADYRCWVVDDNLRVDEESYASAAQARNAALRSLKSQLGV
jgi:hypothetical protein